MEKKPVKPDKTPIGYQFDCIIDNIQPEVNGHGYITLKTHAKINGRCFFSFLYSFKLRSEKTENKKNNKRKFILLGTLQTNSRKG